MIRTMAWVLYPKTNGDAPKKEALAQLRLEPFCFPDLLEHEVLAEPVFGCWEGNMNHALQRHPVDICEQRKEAAAVIGNAGVVRVLKPGPGVHNLKEDDLCLVFCNGVWDKFGYPQKIYAYDAPGTVGLLAKRTKLHEQQLIPVPQGSRHSIEQWAAFSLRFITAWANWKLAFGAWKVQACPDSIPNVWGWGGGVTLAELMLARLSGCCATMVASKDERLKVIEECGIESLDRRHFPYLSFEPEKYQDDPDYRQRYLDSEAAFLETVRQKTKGLGVSIFIDYIGLPVFRATLKSLGRPGVITTAGWKGGMNLGLLRAVECINWHTHVHTHYARYQDALEAIAFAEETGWAPPRETHRWTWEGIPDLAREYAFGQIASLFPIYEVSPL